MTDLHVFILKQSGVQLNVVECHFFSNISRLEGGAIFVDVKWFEGNSTQVHISPF